MNLRTVGLNIQAHQPKDMHVLVANGGKLPCKTLCSLVSIKLDSYSTVIDLYIIPLSGFDLVLRGKWLKTLDLFYGIFITYHEF